MRYLRVVKMLALSCVAEAFLSAPLGRRDLTVRRYEPGPVDGTVVAQQLTVLSVTGLAAWFWWTVTVPEKRVELSKSKKTGEIKTLLDDLETAEDRPLERWLLTDWLNPTKRKEPALPFLPKDKFNSGDNPILAATALILAFGLANAIAERSFAVFHF